MNRRISYSAGVSDGDQLSGRVGRTRISFAVLALLIVTAIAAGAERVQPSPDGVIHGGGWQFSGSDLHPYPWTPPMEEVRKTGGFRQLRGWVEYPFEVPRSGWYSLWLGGGSHSQNRDVSIDGSPVATSSYSTEQDSEHPEKQRSDRGLIKERNVFLRKGTHVIRLGNERFPGNLPNRWELRPANGNPEAMVAAVFDGNPLMAPGARVSIKILGGGTAPVRYTLRLHDYYNDTDIPVGEVDFPVSDTPIEKEFGFTIDSEGVYLLLASANGRTLRPSTLKTAPLVVYKPPRDHLQPAGLPENLEVMGLLEDGAVLQRDRPVPIWGWTVPGKRVTASMSGQTKTAIADEQGRWLIYLDAMGAGGPHVLTVTDGETELSIGDILIGEVWLFAGQSNMSAPLLNITDGPKAARRAWWPGVRQAKLKNRVRGARSQRYFEGATWLPYMYDPRKGDGSMAFANGIAYAFCTGLHQELDVPVGAIINNRGGTEITTWTSLNTQRQTPAYKQVLDTHREQARSFSAEAAAAKAAFWTIRKSKSKPEKARAETPSISACLARPLRLAHKRAPAYHYNRLVKPLAPYAIRGVCWYQGESDVANASRYGGMFQAMIDNWRSLWSQPNLPFIYAQIAGTRVHKENAPPPQTCSHSELCEAQAVCMRSTPSTVMVSTYDLPTPEDDVHYRDKLPVGVRMLQAALATVYGRDLTATGPMYRSMTTEGRKVRLSFYYTGRGLMAKGGNLKGFSIAGADRNFVWAEARIDPSTRSAQDGDTVLVWSDDVPNPEAVRYNWTTAPRTGNLYNRDGLPASVFRTDE